MDDKDLKEGNDIDGTELLINAGAGAGGSGEGEDTVGIKGNGSDMNGEEKIEYMNADGGTGGEYEHNLGDVNIDMVGSNTTPQILSE